MAFRVTSVNNNFEDCSIVPLQIIKINKFHRTLFYLFLINPRPFVQTFMIVTFAKTAIMIMRIIRTFSSRRCCRVNPYYFFHEFTLRISKSKTSFSIFIWNIFIRDISTFRHCYTIWPGILSFNFDFPVQGSSCLICASLYPSKSPDKVPIAKPLTDRNINDSNKKATTINLLYIKNKYLIFMISTESN